MKRLLGDGRGDTNNSWLKHITKHLINITIIMIITIIMFRIFYTIYQFRWLQTSVGVPVILLFESSKNVNDSNLQ